MKVLIVRRLLLLLNGARKTILYKNVDKTKELIVDFRRKHKNIKEPVYIHDNVVEQVVGLNYSVRTLPMTSLESLIAMKF